MPPPPPGNAQTLSVAMLLGEVFSYWCMVGGLVAGGYAAAAWVLEAPARLLDYASAVGDAGMF